MTKLSAALAAFASLLVLSCDRAPVSASDPSIIGGRLAADHKFMVGLVFGDENETGCGGTFVKPRVVVTAAHCIDGLDRRIRVRPGSDNVDPANAPLLDVQAVIPHPEYDDLFMQNDVALLIVAPYDAEALGLDIQPLAMNADAGHPADDAAAVTTVIGRGNTSSFGSLFEDVLREVDVNVVPTSRCAELYDPESITDGQICTGDTVTGGVDSCQGDSGGPLVAKKDGVLSLVGVVSWGTGCAQKKGPGVYTRVSKVFDWVNAEIARLEAPLGDAPTSERLTELFEAYCYGTFADTLKLGAGERTGLVKADWTADGAFEPTAEIAGRDAGDDVCQIALLGGETLTARMVDASAPGDGADRAFRIDHAGKSWTAPAANYSKSLTLACADSLEASLQFRPTGFSYVAMGADFYILDAARFEDVPAGAFTVTCKVGEQAFDFIVAPTEGGVLSYMLRVKGDEFGDDAGKVYDLSKYEGESGLAGELEAGKLTLKNDTETDIFTWELSCNFPFALKDEFGATYAAVADGSSHTVTFIAPAHLHGSFASKSAKSFAVDLPSGAPSPLCRVNGTILALTVK